MKIQIPVTLIRKEIPKEKFCLSRKILIPFGEMIINFMRI